MNVFVGIKDGREEYRKKEGEKRPWKKHTLDVFPELFFHDISPVARDSWPGACKVYMITKYTYIYIYEWVGSEGMDACMREVQNPYRALSQKSYPAESKGDTYTLVF